MKQIPNITDPVEAALDYITNRQPNGIVPVNREFWKNDHGRPSIGARVMGMKQDEETLPMCAARVLAAEVIRLRKFIEDDL